MTFGTVRWGSGDDVPEGVFNAYEDAGGNFVDTANVYSGGKSEEMLGGYIAGRHLRDQVVLATKLGPEESDGEKCTGKLNGRPEYARKSIERSLRNLGTDYVDLYYLHHLDPKPHRRQRGHDEPLRGGR